MWLRLRNVEKNRCLSFPLSWEFQTGISISRTPDPFLFPGDPRLLINLPRNRLSQRGKSRLPGGSDGKASACSAGDPGLIPGLGRSPGEGNGNSLQYFCLGNLMDRGAWWASPWGHKESDTTEWVTLSLSRNMWGCADFSLVWLSARGERWVLYH